MNSEFQAGFVYGDFKLELGGERIILLRALQYQVFFATSSLTYHRIDKASPDCFGYFYLKKQKGNRHPSKRSPH